MMVDPQYREKKRALNVCFQDYQRDFIFQDPELHLVFESDHEASAMVFQKKVL